jgi:TonB family protein
VNPTISIPSGWTRERRLLATGVLFTLHVALIFLFASHSNVVHPPARQATQFHLISTPLAEADVGRFLFASDPTVFVSANFHGFSGAAWMERPAQKYDLADANETPIWLGFNPENLGQTASMLDDPSAPAPLPQVEESLPQADPLPLFLSAPTVKTQSVFKLEGELASRPLRLSLPLPSWTRNELVTNSVVQISANAVGEIVSARLLTRSGYPTADNEALAIARTARFQPDPDGKPSSWGKMIFQWSTLLPEATNSTVKP